MIKCREMKRADIPEMTRVRNSIFTRHAIAEADWNEDETAVLAFENGRMVGAIPLDMRDFTITPGVNIRTAFENSVGVVKGMRGKGVGTAMIECAAKFLQRRCHALFVYRGGETSRPYNFYRKTGHHDLHFTRRYTLARPAKLRRSPLITMEAGEALRFEPQLLRMFRDCYGRMAGFRAHERGYYAAALDSHIFQEMRYDFVRLGCVEAGGGMRAYALFCGSGEQVIVLEMAARHCSNAAMAKLLAGLGDFAARRNAELVVPTSDTSPFIGTMRRMGFAGGPRGRIILARILRPKAVFDLVWKRPAGLRDLKLVIWTPTFSFTALEGSKDGPSVTLEMKEETMTRLLLARLDLASAITEERVTVRGGDEKIVRRICRGFRFCPWIYHHLDDI